MVQPKLKARERIVMEDFLRLYLLDKGENIGEEKGGGGLFLDPGKELLVDELTPLPVDEFLEGRGGEFFEERGEVMRLSRRVMVAEKVFFHRVCSG